MGLRILPKEVRKAFQDDIHDARVADDEDLVAALREERRELRKELREERRAVGGAPDQVVGKALAKVWNQEKADEFVRETLADLAVDILEGELDLLEAVDEALSELSEDADELLDFSGVPVVGGLLEMVDGPLFDMFLRESLRPWVESELRKILE